MPWRRTSTPPPTHFAAKCCVCHTGTESRSDWLDADIEVEGEGTYLICVPCIVEAAGLVDMVSEDSVNELLERALLAELRLEAAETKVTEATALVEALRRFDAGSPLATPAPAADTESGVTSSAPDSVESDPAPVMDHACPIQCPESDGRRWPSERGANHHADLKHRGWRDQ